MTQAGVPPEIIERLRVNLKLARINLAEPDFQGMIDKGFLNVVMAFEEYALANPSPDLPDYLKDWGAGAAIATGNPTPLKPYAAPKTPLEQVKRGGPDWA